MCYRDEKVTIPICKKFTVYWGVDVPPNHSCIPSY